MTTTTPSKFYPSDTPCRRCGNVERYLSDNRCCQCRQNYLKKRSQSPEGKAALKRYWQSKKGKAKQKEYAQSGKRKQYLTQWNASDHGKMSRRYEHVKRTYNLPKDKYDTLLKEQNSNCAICQKFLARPYVDHDHKCCEKESSCGKCIRGLICFNCNRLLSDAHDNVEILYYAINYLQRRNPSS